MLRVIRDEHGVQGFAPTAKVIGIATNTLRDFDRDGKPFGPRALPKVEEAYRKALRARAGYGGEDAARRRQQLIGALHTMSDAAIEMIYDDVLRALKDDMDARYSPAPATPPAEDSETDRLADDVVSGGADDADSEQDSEQGDRRIG